MVVSRNISNSTNNAIGMCLLSYRVLKGIVSTGFSVLLGLKCGSYPGYSKATTYTHINPLKNNNLPQFHGKLL
jgi:hypothetical protein